MGPFLVVVLPEMLEDVPSRDKFGKVCREFSYRVGGLVLKQKSRYDGGGRLVNERGVSLARPRNSGSFGTRRYVAFGDSPRMRGILSGNGIDFFSCASFREMFDRLKEVGG